MFLGLLNHFLRFFRSNHNSLASSSNTTGKHGRKPGPVGCKTLFVIWIFAPKITFRGSGADQTYIITYPTWYKFDPHRSLGMWFLARKFKLLLELQKYCEFSRQKPSPRARSLLIWLHMMWSTILKQRRLKEISHRNICLYCQHWARAYGLKVVSSSVPFYSWYSLFAFSAHLKKSSWT